MEPLWDIEQPAGDVSQIQVRQNGISQSSWADRSVVSESSRIKAFVSSESTGARASAGSQSQVWAKTKPVSSNWRSSPGCFCARKLSLLAL